MYLKITGFILVNIVLYPLSVNANLLLNGSFEIGPDPGTFTQLSIGSTVIDGWEVIQDNIDYVGTTWPASDGSRSIDLAPSSVSGAGGISQSFSTSNGIEYSVQFDMAGNPGFGAGSGVKNMRVQAAGQFADFSFDTAGHTLSDIGWETQTWTFLATGSTTTLEFLSLDSPEFFGPALDNVSVNIVPIPTAIWLFGSGIIGLLGFRKSIQKIA
ncbi:MAG: choice-of-anchor C family protein [Candidatus Thiodiazotropha sp.]